MVQHRLTRFGPVKPHRTPSSSLLHHEPSLHRVPSSIALSGALFGMYFGQSDRRLEPRSNIPLAGDRCVHPAGTREAALRLIVGKSYRRGAKFPAGKSECQHHLTSTLRRARKRLPNSIARARAPPLSLPSETAALGTPDSKRCDLKPFAYLRHRFTVGKGLPHVCTNDG